MQRFKNMIILFEHDFSKRQEKMSIEDISIYDFPCLSAREVEYADIVVLMTSKHIRVLKDRYNAITTKSGRLMKIMFVEEYTRGLNAEVGRLTEMFGKD